jgi:hypothetical protein
MNAAQMAANDRLERIAFAEVADAMQDVPDSETLSKPAVLQLMKFAFMRGYSACSEQRNGTRVE